MEAKDILLGHMDDLAAKAVKSGCAASRFLTPAEQRDVASIGACGRKTGDFTLIFDGGYENAERARAIFLNSDWGEYEQTELFTALKITHRPQDTLGHRDILGAIMALGIERDTVGDIVMDEHTAALVCLPELSGYIIENLTKAGRVGISLSEISLDELSVRQEELTIKTDTVASLRLDAVLCAAFGLSRTKAAELIAADRVSLDHQPCVQPAKELIEGALLSVRGLGRAKLLEIGGVSKKGRLFIRVGLYGR
jgi:RNA-binding protein YlmH